MTGVESPSSYWRKWSTQSEPEIAQTALLTGRTGTAESLLAKIRASVEPGARNILSIKGDSVEEAVAVTAACLMGDPELSAAAAIVTEAGGWRFVDRNPQIKNCRIVPTGNCGIAFITRGSGRCRTLRPGRYVRAFS